jgi:hypothetical protein
MFPPQTPSDSDSPRSPQQPPSGLSTGGKAGIGVGIPILVVLFALGLWFAFRYGRRTQAAAEIKHFEPQTFSEESPSTVQIQEIGSSLIWEEKRELEGRRGAAELEVKSISVRPGMSERPELEAWRRGGVFELGLWIGFRGLSVRNLVDFAKHSRLYNHGLCFVITKSVSASLVSPFTTPTYRTL